MKAHSTAAAPAGNAGPRAVRGARWAAAAVVLGLALLAALPALGINQYYQNMLLLTFLFCVLGCGWNIMAGYAGYVSLGQSAFLGIGAYTAAILAVRWHLSPFLVAPLGGLVAAVFALAVGLVVLRTRGHSFVIITIALLFILQIVALNWPQLTNGSTGITLPLPPFKKPWQTAPFYWYMLALAALSVWLSAWIRRTKFGMGLIAIREDEDKAGIIGINTTLYKITAFMASVFFTGIAGGVYAYYLTFIDPIGMFNILLSVQTVLVTMLGGRGTVWGPVLGAFVLEPLNETSYAYFGSNQSHLVVFGLAMMLIVLFLPRGIIPTVGDWWAARTAAARGADGSAQAAAAAGTAPGAGAAGPRAAAAAVGEEDSA
ncbi:MAG: branched-chain amino acid ABC transporter permease [Firmicutes bacterium]|nr:branched-chain amino acid ABC transporter permease [Bacillota bacterium]